MWKSKLIPAVTYTESRTEILSLNTKKHYKNNKMSKINFVIILAEQQVMIWLRSYEFEAFRSHSNLVRS